MNSIDELYIKHKKLVTIVSENISQMRMEHSMRVAELAYTLAVQHSYDSELAWVSGIAHDYCRELDFQEMYSLACQAQAPYLLGDFAEEYIQEIKSACSLTNITESGNAQEQNLSVKNRDVQDDIPHDSLILFHGLAVVAALFEYYWLPYSVYTAIATHTLGTVSKSPHPLEKILFIADALEPHRKLWNESDRMKIVNELDCNTQLIVIIDRLENYYNNIHPITIKMRNNIKEKL